MKYCLLGTYHVAVGNVLGDHYVDICALNFRLLTFLHQDMVFLERIAPQNQFSPTSNLYII